MVTMIITKSKDGLGMVEIDIQQEEPSDAEKRFNSQVNYIIIEKLWKYMHPHEDIQNLYELLDINKNAYSRIRTAKEYQRVNLENRWNRKNSPISSMGLSKEIMTGQVMMEIDGIKWEEWDKYIRYRYEEKEEEDKKGKEDKKKRIRYMQNFNRKLHEVFRELTINKSDKRDIAKLFYFFTYGRAVNADIDDIEMLELKDSLNNVNVEKMKICDMELKKEVCRLLREKYKQLNIIVGYQEL